MDKYNGTFDDGYYFLKSMPKSWDSMPRISIPPLDQADTAKANNTYNECKLHVFKPYMSDSRYTF